MIYEHALLPVKSDRIDAFQRAFGQVVHLLTRAKGYQGHRLMQGVETPSHFHLIVQWQSLEDHTHGFEPSVDHQALIAAVQAYFAAEPLVYHVRAAAAAVE